MTARTSEPHRALLADLFGAIASGTFHASATGVLAPDVAWHVAGDHPLAGDYSGVAQVEAFFAALSKACLRAEVLFREADDLRTVQLHRATAPGVELTFALVCEIADGRITRATSFAADQHAADEFFRATFQSAPSPAQVSDPDRPANPTPTPQGAART